MTPAELRRLSTQADHGDSQAMVEIGQAYHYGLTTFRSDSRAAAIGWYERAAALGNLAAERELGYLYADDDRWPGVKADETRAFAWFLRAAQSGDAPAQGPLAGYFETPGPRQDYRKAYRWRLKAARQGDEVSAEKLDEIYTAGCDASDFATVFAQVEAAAKAGDSDAQWRLGMIEADDAFGRRDAVASPLWLQKSAAQRNAKGLYYLAVHTYTGGAQSDGDAKVVPLLAQSADKGFVPAQLWWTRFYQAPPGLDASHDPVERRIFEWFRAAAEEGYDEAQDSLSHYYDKGLFVPVDRAEAYKWYLLSWHSPMHDGIHVAFIRDATMAEQVEGRARAQAWLAAHSQPYPVPVTATAACPAGWPG
jgi:TPR repeat protein